MATDRDGIKKTLRLLDSGDGKISTEDFIGVFIDILPQWSESDVRDLISGANITEKGTLDYSTFVDWMFADEAKEDSPASQKVEDDPLLGSKEIFLPTELDKSSLKRSIDIAELTTQKATFKSRLTEVDYVQNTGEPSDDRIGIQSPYSKVAGMYAKVVDAENEGRQVFKREDKDSQYYYLFADGAWRITSDIEGKTRIPNCECNDDATHPADAAGGWTDFLTGVERFRKVDPECVAKAPQKLCLTCCKADTGQRCTLGGGFMRVDDYQDYPCYVSKPDGLSLYHDSASCQWIIGSGAPGSRSYYDKLTTAVANPIDLCGEWDEAGNIVEISEVTWEEGFDQGGFEDTDFPADETSLGDYSEFEWVRASKLIRGTEMKVVDGKINPNGLLEGGGELPWLIAALACIAEVPKRLEDVFQDGMEINTDGKYRLRLYIASNEDWDIIEIDDRIPCKPFEWWQEEATCLFSKPKGVEIWMLLLEKAFAKIHGKYEELINGDCLWVWQAITGCSHCCIMEKVDAGGWNQNTLNAKAQVVEDKSSFSSLKSMYTCQSCPMFNKSVEYTHCKTDTHLADYLSSMGQRQFIMGASITHRSYKAHKAREDGLVTNCAYTILGVMREPPGDIEALVQLRNTWGKLTQWKGVWGNMSNLWDQHPKVALECDFDREDRSSFWMKISDFRTTFNVISICKVRDPEETGPVEAHWYRQQEDILDARGNISAIKLSSSNVFLGGVCRYFRNQDTGVEHDAADLIRRCSEDDWFTSRLRDVARILGDCPEFEAELNKALDTEGYKLDRELVEKFHQSVGQNDPMYGFEWWMGLGGAEALLLSAFSCEYRSSVDFEGHGRVDDAPGRFLQDLTEMVLECDEFESQCGFVGSDLYWLDFMLTN